MNKLILALVTVLTLILGTSFAAATSKTMQFQINNNTKAAIEVAYFSQPNSVELGKVSAFSQKAKTVMENKEASGNVVLKVKQNGKNSKEIICGLVQKAATRVIVSFNEKNGQQTCQLTTNAP